MASELGPHMKLLDSAIDAFLARFGNAARLLAEQLDAHGVRVWLSAGCLTEFAEIARVAAGRSRQVEEPYGSCLRREMQTLTRFIWEWTDSDRKFDLSQYAELVAIAHKYALPRPWRVTEPHASVRGHTVVAQPPAAATACQDRSTVGGTHSQPQGSHAFEAALTEGADRSHACRSSLVRWRTDAAARRG